MAVKRACVWVLWALRLPKEKVVLWRTLENILKLDINS